jgi:hypothetical protein
MTREDIIRMAQEVSGVSYPTQMEGVAIGMNHDHLERFANLVAAAEREACAEVCELMYDYGWLDAKRCAREIRARGLENLNKAAEMNGEEL